jgi:hypothetical protein
VTLRVLRRAQLRTRVLAGVLAVTVIALVAFDFAAVGALRRYLVGHTDAQLQSVLGLYRPMTITLPPGANWSVPHHAVRAGSQRMVPPGLRPVDWTPRPSPGGPRVQQVIADRGSRSRRRSWRSSRSGSSAGSARGSSSAGTPPWSRASLPPNCNMILPRSTAHRA